MGKRVVIVYLLSDCYWNPWNHRVDPRATSSATERRVVQLFDPGEHRRLGDELSHTRQVCQRQVRTSEFSPLSSGIVQPPLLLEVSPDLSYVKKGNRC